VRVLFDQGTPVPLRNYFGEHNVATAAEMGWSRLSNGQLLDAAEEQFDLLITTDQALRTQQNLASRKLAVLILPFASWPRLKANAEKIVSRATRSAHCTPGLGGYWMKNGLKRRQDLRGLQPRSRLTLARSYYDGS
jgi:hypothetical protein